MPLTQAQRDWVDARIEGAGALMREVHGYLRLLESVKQRADDQDVPLTQDQITLLQTKLGKKLTQVQNGATNLVAIGAALLAEQKAQETQGG